MTERDELAEAQKKVAQAANRVSTVASHAARMSILREPAAAMPWVVELRDVADTLKDALDELQPAALEVARVTPLEVATIARDMTTASSTAARLAILEPDRVDHIAAHIEHARNLGIALVRALKADT